MKRFIFLIFIIILVVLGVILLKPKPIVPDTKTISDGTQIEIKTKSGREIPRQSVREGYRAITFEVPQKQLPSNFQVNDFLNIYASDKNLVAGNVQVLNLKLENQTGSALVAIEVPRQNVRKIMFSAIKGPLTFIGQNKNYSFLYHASQKNISAVN